MGWTTCYNWQKKQDIIDETKRNYEKSGFEIIGINTCREAIYIGVKHKETQHSYIFIGLVRFNISDKTWSLKDLTENCGPYVAKCKPKLLDACPNTRPNEYSIKWREACRKNAIPKPKLPDLVGKMIELYGKKYVVTAKNGRAYSAIGEHDNCRYKLTQKNFKSIKVLGDVISDEQYKHLFGIRG